MKLPHNMGREELARHLRKYGYRVTRKTRSHIRLTSYVKGKAHQVTVPRNYPQRVGTIARATKEPANPTPRDVSSGVLVDRLWKPIFQFLKRLSLFGLLSAILHVDNSVRFIDIWVLVHLLAAFFAAFFFAQPFGGQWFGWLFLGYGVWRTWEIVVYQVNSCSLIGGLRSPTCELRF